MSTKQNRSESDEEDTQSKTSKRGGGAGDIVEDFIEDIWQVMTPELIERLRCVLIEDMKMTREDADKLIQCQRDIRRQRICLRKEKRIVRIGPRNQWIKEVARDVADLMATFIVETLISHRSPRAKKLTEKILDRLCELTGEDTTPEYAKTRVERILVVIADRLATWIDENLTEFEQKLKEKYPSVESLHRISEVSSETESFTESSTESEEINLVTSETESEIQIEEPKLDGSRDKEDKEDSKDKEKAKSKEKEKPGKVKEKEKAQKPEKEDSEMSETEESEEGTVTESDKEGDTTGEEEEESEEEDEDTGEEEAEKEEGEEDGEEEEVVEEVEGESEEEEDDESYRESDGGIEKPDSREEKRESEKEDVLSDEEKKPPIDILELLKEDITSIPKTDNKSERQKVMKEIIDKRFKDIAKEKLDKSLDSIINYDIDETASVVANWIEKILSATDISTKLSTLDTKRQGPAFEIKPGDGSQYEVHKLSSYTVAQKVAEIRGLEPPPQKKKLPKTMSPINEKSARDWADWALGTATTGEEWGKWLDATMDDIEKKLMDKSKIRESQQRSSKDRYNEWKNWRDIKAKEAQQWRAEKQKIKGEGSLWDRKLKNETSREKEKETRSVDY